MNHDNDFDDAPQPTSSELRLIELIKKTFKLEPLITTDFGDEHTQGKRVIVISADCAGDPDRLMNLIDMASSLVYQRGIEKNFGYEVIVHDDDPEYFDAAFVPLSYPAGTHHKDSMPEPVRRIGKKP